MTDTTAYLQGETVDRQSLSGIRHNPGPHNLVGRVDGEINPTMVSISHPVSFADLDLRRVNPTSPNCMPASPIPPATCAIGWIARYPDLRDRDSEHRECVRNAIRNAMAQVAGKAPPGKETQMKKQRPGWKHRAFSASRPAIARA